jgi:hypothetical protein
MPVEYLELNPKKLQHIALSFSGGGFRAASYCLGCLSYLEHMKVEDQPLTRLVNFISSASGGTITNLAYTSSQRNGKSFNQFYKDITEKTLQGGLLVDRVFAIMQDPTCWRQRPLKSRNLINAFAMAYDEMLFQGETFDVYRKAVSGAVPEVCANTTEFDNGMLFRFQTAGVAGNKFLSFKKDEVSQDALHLIKLGDILAASSCFTVGFEPIMFPKDFTHAKLEQISLENAMKADTRFSPAKDDSDVKACCFGLMDGGIDDNQGIDSFIRAEERLQNQNHFGHDLFISCDVSSNFTSGYEFPQENLTNIFLKPSLYQYIGGIVSLFVASVAGLLYTRFTGLAYALLGISSALALLIAALFFRGISAYRKSIRSKNTFGILIFKYLQVFLKLRLSTFLQTLNSRATSAGYLAAVVFLKKIRRISYDRLFEKVSERKLKIDGSFLKDGDDDSLLAKIELKHWSRFSLQNALYLLSKKNNPQRESDIKKEPWYKNNLSVLIQGEPFDLNELMIPSAEVQRIADLATDMDTTLWFDQNHINDQKPAALIAAGQFTTCYNLLRYVFRFDCHDPYWSELQLQLTKDWYRFSQNPFWLHDAYHDRSPIESDSK